MLVRLFNVKQPCYFQETVVSVDKQIETEVVLANDVALSMISARLQSNMKIHLGEHQ